MLFAACLGAFFSVFLSYITVKNDQFTSVQQTRNELLDGADQVGESNKSLWTGNDNVMTLSDRLERLQRKLRSIAEQQGEDAEYLIKLVKRNKTAFKGMHENAKAEAAQKLVELVIEGDKDGNFVIDDEETEILYLKLSNFKTYITVDKQNFYDAIQREKGEIQGVMKIVRTLVDDDDIREEDKIFFIDDDCAAWNKVGRKSRKTMRKTRKTMRRTKLPRLQQWNSVA
eukprot:CAMPEP_0116040448 /NCGR_PEP_ID=MMETSP0321-20121206/24371_1 /TAXON_ID=163516 /ORGANISM="Leptocylindrus danicus var. danicus, Strain B650" /LENGTH=227 /DNA_ID=CAMNT_0003520277 /DNA_START=1 /DNA_END=684 /DNA_ORIENTATION=+